MFFLKKRFSFIMFMAIAVATLFSKSVLTMNKGKVVSAPFARYMIPLSNDYTMQVHEKYYHTFDTMGLGEYYQVNQFLYNEEADGQISAEIKAPLLEYDKEGSAWGTLQVFVSEPLAGLMDENGTVVTQVPMGSSFYVKECGDPEFFEFIDHKSHVRRILKSSVHTTTDLALLNDDEFRERLCDQALKLVGQPFQWGGRCAGKGSGFDASGFINIVYLSCGVKIERSLIKQYKIMNILNPQGIKKGDLIFMCNNKGLAETVMLYLGDDKIIQAYPFDGSGKITEAKFSDLFGKEATNFNNGQSIGVILGEEYFFQCRRVLRGAEPLCFV